MWNAFFWLKRLFFWDANFFGCSRNAFFLITGWSRYIYIYVYILLYFTILNIPGTGYVYQIWYLNISPRYLTHWSTMVYHNISGETYDYIIYIYKMNHISWLYRLYPCFQVLLNTPFVTKNNANTETLAMVTFSGLDIPLFPKNALTKGASKNPEVS